MSKPRTLAVGGVIVTCILFAIAANDWWRGRQVAHDEKRILYGLKEELESLHDVLSRQLDECTRNLESLEFVSQSFENPPSNGVKPIIDTALAVMTGSATSNIDYGGLDVVMNSIGTFTVTNSKMRANLSAWQFSIDEMRGDQEIAANMVNEVYIPYLTSKNFAVDSAASGAHHGRPIWNNTESDDPDAITQLLADPQFEVLVEGRLGFQRHLIVELENAIAATDAIIKELEYPMN